MQSGDWTGPPVAAMYMAGFTHTNSPQDAPPGPGPAHQRQSGFATGLRLHRGRLIGNVGSFIQVTGDPVGGTAFLDASDVRYADTFKLFGQDTIWGIDVNNTPDGRRSMEYDAIVRLAANLLDDRARIWRRP